MKIVVCLKQVPDTGDIKWTQNNTIQREGLESVTNPCDVYALEQALSLKEKYQKTSIVGISMGPEQAKVMLRKAIALGIDDALLLSDKKFSGSDTYATAKILSTAIKKYLSDFDLIICGQYAADGDTAQTGPSIANFLDIPQVTFVKEIIEHSNNAITVIKECDDGEEKIKITLPALICVLKNESELRRIYLNGYKNSAQKKIDVITNVNLNLDDNAIGFKGSPTYVNKTFRVQKSKNCEYIENSEILATVMKKCVETRNE